MQRISKFFKYAITVAYVIFLTGCAPNQPLDISKATLSNPSTLVVTNREIPNFAAATAGKAALFGAFSAIPAATAGNEIIQQNNVKDPAKKIAAALSRELITKYGVRLLKSSNVVSGTKTEKIITAYPNADWILDIQTGIWGFTHFLTDLTRYKVNYSVLARLIDTRDQKIIAKDFCIKESGEKANAPKKDALLANNAARLKKELAIAVDQCVTQFRSKMLLL